MSRLIAELDAALARRSGQDLSRRRRIVESAQGARLSVDGREILHFGSNDYLGLAGHPQASSPPRSRARRAMASAPGPRT